MFTNWQWMFVLLIGVSSCAAETTLMARYQMSGVTGAITFRQQTAGDDVTVELNLEGLENAAYTLELHEFRVNFDTPDRCGNDVIGSIIGTATVTSGKGSLSVGGLDLSGTRSIEGRSFVVRDNGNIRICATIEADAEYITAFAHLPATLGGTVVFRQQLASPRADTFMYLDLYWVSENRLATELSWDITTGHVSMDIEATTPLNARCGSIIGSMYNPASSSGTSCSDSNHSSCPVGDLTSKHGGLLINSTSGLKAFYGDLNLPLSGVNSIIGKTIAFRNGNANVACANIIQYSEMKAETKFSDKGVSGAIRFSQKSPFDSAIVAVDLANLNLSGGGYHVHNWPVPLQTVAGEGLCDASDVSGHFNPFDVHTGSGYPKPATTTTDMYEVGDFSGKFGVLNDMATYVKNFTDPNLQLFGKNTIIGRSLVIHAAGDGSRWICSTIWPTQDIPMTVAYSTFTYPVIGMIVLRQPKDQWHACTQIYMELDYGTERESATINHNWHIHETPLGADFLSPNARCQSAGGHYNPYKVDLNGDYMTHCNNENHFRCELGDLSGKHGKINVRSSSGGKMKYFFSDMQLPLSGPQSIIGKSITIHDANSAGERLSCANIYEKKRRVVKISKWSAALGQGSPTGTITFSQDSLQILSGQTEVSVQLSNLISDVAAYHIHEFPTDPSTPPEDVCQAADVGGHMNPFDAKYPYTGAAQGTQDMYEIGDLSGKYNMISGTSYSRDVIDKTLALDGPYSIVGRSVVIHKSDAGATRWACGTIVDATAGSSKVAARAEFTGDISGYVYMEQYHYDSGDRSSTFIIVELRYQNSTVTMGHNWHVHQKHVARTDDGCMSCGPHYNPFMVDMGTGYRECSMSNPLRCEVGDQSSKLGRYDVGGGKRAYTDVNLNVEGAFAAAKRSVVIHGANGAEERIACADLVPYGDGVMSYDLSFPVTEYERDEAEATFALSLNTDVDNVMVARKTADVSCATVTVYFLGEDKAALKLLFVDLVRSNDHNRFGKFKPTVECHTSKGGEPAKAVRTNVRLPGSSVLLPDSDQASRAPAMMIYHTTTAFIVLSFIQIIVFRNNF
ncbi:uncharacterized protein LOC128211398 isoform X2 [Mya arenaria]|uniref:uncharacterized protein LOC128211398 isoform X2 n=1 Tax=Mya arenaria TaxID=6604 RepID=UPI0022E081EF|nr:uncharacterized protein LOC128211398 isoform X2 [Mya arenaria]